MRRDLGPEIARGLDLAIRRSILLAREEPERVWGYVAEHAQEMSADVQRQHVDLYVNDFSVDLGETGVEAVESLFGRARRAGLLPDTALPLMAY